MLVAMPHELLWPWSSVVLLARLTPPLLVLSSKWTIKLSMRLGVVKLLANNYKAIEHWPWELRLQVARLCLLLTSAPLSQPHTCTAGIDIRLILHISGKTHPTLYHVSLLYTNTDIGTDMHTEKKLATALRSLRFTFHFSETSITAITGQWANNLAARKLYYRIIWVEILPLISTLLNLRFHYSSPPFQSSDCKLP